ncbi:hypothetical protein [Pseudomonas sp. NFR09]|uniref:hypothetical protein n=1 Tax=Pseudomonas sp. NFR09 TaxID=1566249 RepID=UPI001114606B|nr:hypothetical protein [Pseudomonas sp. NFR09]
MLIDFNEVTYHQDWECFAMAFVEILGLDIEARCAVGPDGGRDFIASENVRFGGKYRWLVSCKHRGSGTIGSSDDEAKDHRLREFQCNGFMFIYNRPLTSGLLQSFERVQANTGAGLKVFTDREIESTLVGSPDFYLLIRQYFPKSWERLAPALQSNDCDCGHTAGSIYLIPFTDPRTRQVEHQLCCDYCGSHTTEAMRRENVHYGKPILIHPEPY